MSMKNVNTENNKPEVFFDASAYDFVNKYNLGSFINVNYLAIVKFNLSLFFSKKEYDLSTFIPDFSTVVQTCICSAMYMGFKKIVLLGCDQTSILNVINSRMENAHVVDYAYEISVAEQKRLEEMAKKTTLSEEFASQAHVFETYSFLSNYCCQKGIELVNATDGSLIESIKKVELEDVLQK